MRSCARRDGPQAEAPATPADKGRPTSNAAASQDAATMVTSAIVTFGRDPPGGARRAGVAEAVERGRADRRGDARMLLDGVSDHIARKRPERLDRGTETVADDPARAGEMAIPATSRTIGVYSGIDTEDIERASLPTQSSVGGIE